MRMDTIPKRFFGLVAMVMRIRSGVGLEGMLKGIGRGSGVDVGDSLEIIYKVEIAPTKDVQIYYCHFFEMSTHLMKRYKVNKHA